MILCILVISISVSDARRNEHASKKGTSAAFQHIGWSAIR
jgi:hypothetical protein